MKQWIKTYWLEILVIAGIFGVLLACAAPDYTWINTDSDGVHYVYSAKYLYPAHKTSAPLFLLLGHVFLWLPFGSEFFRMALISVIASTASALLIYLILKEKLGEKGRLHGITGALIFGGSALVISQSTIVETYALVTMCGLAAYYFAIKGKWLYCALALGSGIAVHHLIGITMVVLFIFFKELRHWKYTGAMLAFLLFYLYIPLTNRAPYIWTFESNSIQDFLADNVQTALMLIGGLSIWDFPKRVLDTLGILGVSLGLALIPLAYFAIRRKWYKEPLVWLFIVPIVYYAIDLAPQTYVYMMPAIGFGAVMAGIGLSKIPIVKYFVLAFAICMLIVTANFFDIGRTLDPKLGASEYYYKELDKVADGEILMPSRDWEWVAIYSYNRNFGRNIQPVCIGLLPSLAYQEGLKAQGIKLQDYPEINIGLRGTYIAKSIYELNDANALWTTQSIDSRTYSAEIIPIGESKDLFYVPEDTTHPTWQWKPSNPYDIMTGAIEVDEWTFLTWSNYSMLTFIMMGGIGVVPIWIGWQVFVKKKKWSLKKKQEVISNGQNS